MKELTRAENLQRAKAGMREDRNDGIWAQHNHKFGLNSTAMPGLTGKPWRADEDPTHDCQQNGCKIGRHYIKPTPMSRGAFDVCETDIVK